MVEKAVELKKTPAAPAVVPDVWQSFRSEMDRLFDRFDGSFRAPTLRRLFEIAPFEPGAASIGVNVPAVEVSEDDKAYTVTAELPGLDEKSVELSLAGNRLVLKGEKRQEKEEKDKSYYLSERSYGVFQRSFSLPGGVDADNVAAIFDKGVLTVTLPKTAEAQQQKKKIEIKAA